MPALGIYGQMQNSAPLNIIDHREALVALLTKFPQGVVALDLETTGLSPHTHEIVEMGAVKLTPGLHLSEYRQLVKPKNPISQQSTSIHGITDEMVKDAPSLDASLSHFLSFIDGHPLIGHNLLFDITFLTYAMNLKNIAPSDQPIYDSCKMARTSLRKNGPKSYKLSSLSEFFNIKLQFHRAFDDALASLICFGKCLVPLTKEQMIKSFDQSYLFNWKELSLDALEAREHIPEILRQAITTNQPINIIYEGGSHGLKPRPILPIALIYSHKGVKLHALCLLSHNNKAFKLDRIKEFQKP
jgi:DNA polymerase-3 subunit epsilon